VETNSLVDHGRFPLWAAINWSCSSLRTAAVHYMVNPPLSTSIWSYSHPIACCFLFFLCPLLRTSFRCASGVLFSVAAIATSRWSNWCLRCCCVSAGGALDKASVVRLYSNRIAAGWGACWAMTCCCGKVRKMIMKRSGKSRGLYRYLQVQKQLVTAKLHVLFKLDPARYSCKSQGIPNVARIAVSQSNVVCLFTGIYCGERQQKSLVW